MKIVLDTNVLVSGLITPHGPPGRIVDHLREGILELMIDDRILWEYQDVLTRPQLAGYFAGDDVFTIMDYIRHDSHRRIPTRIFNDLPDPEDAPFLEVAYTATVTLVTGNTRHFPETQRGGTRVRTPAEFLRDLR